MTSRRIRGSVRWITGAGGETFTTGSSSTTFDGNIYIAKEATGRLFQVRCSPAHVGWVDDELAPINTATDGGKLLVIPLWTVAPLLPLRLAAHSCRDAAHDAGVSMTARQRQFVINLIRCRRHSWRS